MVTPVLAHDARAARWSTLRLWAPAILWAILLFSLSSISRPPSPPSGVTDKHEHFTAYAVLGALVLRALSGATWSGVTATAVVSAAVIATLYGMSDELHQMFVPLREASWLDVAADAAGAFAAAALIGAWAIIRRRR